MFLDLRTKGAKNTREAIRLAEGPNYANSLRQLVLRCQLALLQIRPILVGLCLCVLGTISLSYRAYRTVESGQQVSGRQLWGICSWAGHKLSDWLEKWRAK